MQWKIQKNKIAKKEKEKIFQKFKSI